LVDKVEVKVARKRSKVKKEDKIENNRKMIERKKKASFRFSTSRKKKE